MASTGIQDGGIAKIGGKNGARTIFTHLINCSITFQHDPREITTKDSSSGAKEFGSGLTGWSLSGEAYFAENATTGYADALAWAQARSKITVYYGSAVSGDKRYQGYGFVSNVTRTAGNQGENESFTIEIQGSGILAEQIVT